MTEIPPGGQYPGGFTMQEYQGAPQGGAPQGGAPQGAPQGGSLPQGFAPQFGATTAAPAVTAALPGGNPAVPGGNPAEPGPGGAPAPEGEKPPKVYLPLGIEKYRKHRHKISAAIVFLTAILVFIWVIVMVVAAFGDKHRYSGNLGLEDAYGFSIATIVMGFLAMLFQSPSFVVFCCRSPFIVNLQTLGSLLSVIFVVIGTSLRVVTILKDKDELIAQCTIAVKDADASYSWSFWYPAPHGSLNAPDWCHDVWKAENMALGFILTTEILLLLPMWGVAWAFLDQLK